MLLFSDEPKIVGLTVSPFNYTLQDENIGQEWKNWLQSFEFCMTASGIVNVERKMAMLLHFAGRKVQEIYINLPEVEIGQQSGPWANGYVFRGGNVYEKAVKKLNDFFLPKQNATYERHVFRSMKQEEDENIGVFAIRLQTQAERCNFDDKIEENIKDQIIEKCRCARMRREML